MKKKGMIAAVAMIAAFIAVMPTAVTANAVSAAEIQEETECLGLRRLMMPCVSEVGTG